MVSLVQWGSTCRLSHIFLCVIILRILISYFLPIVPYTKLSMPNWALTSSDFFAWIEELRSHAGYDKIDELARTFWAHFPSASRLGYDPPAPEE
uniref:Si:ch73-23l24.1 n=1 Tax=Sinocyclocheilus grahami TaxID=75366 RepID=A0A672NLI4_SINGR